MTAQNNVRQIRYLLVFLPLVAALLALPVWAKLRLTDFREVPINFQSLGPQQFINSEGLTRDQLGDLKIGFAETYEPPEIGLFGNHQFQYFGAASLTRAGVRESFFNYWHANISLYDIYDFLAYLADKGKLPRRLIVVQITTPNNDNGGYIVDRSHEMPLDVAFYGQKYLAASPSEQSTDAISLVRKSLQWLKDTYSYSTLTMGLFLRDRSDRQIDLSTCDASTQTESGLTARLARYMPALLARYMGAVTGSTSYYCNPRTWAVLMGGDGAYNADALVSRPELDANPLDPQRNQLTLARMDDLRWILERITALGAQNGVDIVFVIPPVYETERYSVVNTVFDKARESLGPEVKMIDHRKLIRPRSQFINYDHPGPQYFDRLVQDMIRRGLM